jgi:hypothetical protein
LPVFLRCGAASAVATKLTLETYPRERVVIVNAFIKEEHEDNRRFLADCEAWFGHPITTLADTKYGASTDEVWRRERYIKGPNGAPCSRALKRKLLASIDQPSDLKVIGYTVEEMDRFEDLVSAFPDERFAAPLIERGLNHDDCLSICSRAGLVLPAMYRLGYRNANCIGCPKGGQAYWQAIRADFPERFAAVMAIQEEIGPGAYFLQFRSGPRKGERMPLRELPAGLGDMAREPGFTCSFLCDQVFREVSSS